MREFKPIRVDEFELELTGLCRFETCANSLALRFALIACIFIVLALAMDLHLLGA